MGRIFSVIKKNQSLIFCAAAVMLLILICIPLFWVAKYNYMSVDDLGYGANAHQAIQNGQPWKIFGLAAQQTVDSYLTWQGSFSAVFLFTLQPGIWGEKYYRLGIYIIIFCLVSMQSALIWRIKGADGTGVDRKCLVGFCALLYIVQIFYVPYPEECFYWFNGSLYYTVFYTLQILLFSEILVLLRFPAKLNWKQKLFFCWMLFLSAVIGGGNLATGLSTALALCLLMIILFAKKEGHRFYALSVTVIYLLSFLINVAAPGNAARKQYPGYHIVSPVSAVLTTIWNCMMLVYEWTDYKMWLILLTAVPFLWQITGSVTKKWKFTFRFPAAATVLLFGIYASQLTPITYVEGTFGPKRMGDMMWFSYVLWIFSVEGYWIGWFRHRFSERKEINKIKAFVSGNFGIMQLCCLVLWCVLVLMTNVTGSSTYKAGAAIWSGEAKAYAMENEERLKILHDPEITDVYFHAIEHKVEPIYNIDITPDNQSDPNDSMARFYNKNTVNLIE